MPTRKFWLSWYLALVLLFGIGFLSPSARYAQSGATTSEVAGTVLDAQDQVISNAELTIERVDTGQVRTLTSGDNGTFLFTNLTPGSYKLSVNANGFRQLVIDIPDLRLGAKLELKYHLKPAAIDNVVEVKANDNPVLDPQKTESSTSIDSTYINTLPINKRDFLDYSLIVPRSLTDRRPGQGITGTSGLSFNAQNARSNNLTIDGFDNNEPLVGMVRQTFSQEAVQEFQVVTDNYSAEFGRALGGVINIVTKGGSNDLHGSLFFFGRNDSLSAREAFASFKPDFHQYQFGASVGGPIKKNKLFYFASFERFDLKQSNIVTITDAVVASANRLGLPLQNGPIPFSDTQTSVLGRLDWQASANDHLTTRYNYGGTYDGEFEPFGGAIGQTSGSLERLSEHSIAATNTLVSSRFNLVNETRFSYGHRDFSAIPPDAMGGPIQVQLTGDQNASLFGTESSLPSFRTSNIFQVADNVSLARGHHQIKFGAEYIAHRFTADSSDTFFKTGFALFVPFDFVTPLTPNGIFFSPLQNLDPSLRTADQRNFLNALAGIFSQTIPNFPLLPLADLSLPAQFIQGFGSTLDNPRPTTDIFSTFVQDNYQVRSNLMLKLGLRYDIYRASGYPDNNGMINPRIALAYNPTEKLNIHAGFGLFNGAPLTSLTFPARTSTGQITAYQLPFPLSVLPFALPGHEFSDSTVVPPQLQNLPPQLTLQIQLQKNYPPSYSEQADFGIDYQLGKSTRLSVTYLFIRGLKLESERPVNPIVHPLPNDPGLFQSGLTGRLDPSRGTVIEEGTFADSYYNGVTIEVNHQMARRLNFLAHYTYSKAIDDVTDFRNDLIDGMVNPLRPDLERSLSLQDARHRFVFAGTWDIDYTHSALLHNFELSTIITLESGKPYNLLAGQDLNMTGDGPPGDRPIVNGVEIGRNAGITPGFYNVDLRLARGFTFKERFRLRGTFEVFNLFNRVNYDQFNRIYPPSPTGSFNLPPQENGRYILTPDRYLGAAPPRRIQLGAQLIF